MAKNITGFHTPYARPLLLALVMGLFLVSVTGFVFPQGRARRGDTVVNIVSFNERPIVWRATQQPPL